MCRLMSRISAASSIGYFVTSQKCTCTLKVESTWYLIYQMLVIYQFSLCILYTIFVFIDGLVQERRNSSALAMELRLSWTNPSIWALGPNVSTQALRADADMPADIWNTVSTRPVKLCGMFRSQWINSSWLFVIWISVSPIFVHLEISVFYFVTVGDLDTCRQYHKGHCSTCRTVFVL